jgi:hypothetical protein
VADAAFGRAKKQEVAASGKGSAEGTIAGSLVAGLSVGIPGIANLGMKGQGTLAFRAEGDCGFSGKIKRLKPKEGGDWLPWSGEIKFNAKVKGSLIAEAKGYFEYQLLWIIRDQFGHFKIGAWTLAEAGLDVEGTLGPGKPLQVTIKPWVGKLLKPGVDKTLRARTLQEREEAEKRAQAGAAGVPVARMVDTRLARAGADGDAGGAPPPPDAGDAGGAGPAAGQQGAAGAQQGQAGGAAPASGPGAGAAGQKEEVAALAAAAGLDAGAEVIVLEAGPMPEEEESGAPA